MNARVGWLAAATMGLVPGPEIGQGRSTALSGEVTLWAGDETRASFNFANGDFGGVIEDGELILDRTQIAFHLFEPNQLSYGYVRGMVMEIIDLGGTYVPPIERAEDRSPKPELSLFHTLHLRDGQFFYNAPIRRNIRHTEAQRIFQTLPRDGLVSFEPLVGHTYVMRFKERGTRDEESVLVKFLVVDCQEDRSLTLRWQRLQ